jgi:fructose-1,6-bisphosphatase
VLDRLYELNPTAFFISKAKGHPALYDMSLMELVAV